MEEEYLNIIDIDILSVNEAKKLDDDLRDVSTRWWLKPVSHLSGFAPFVCANGSVNENGDFVGSIMGVRPVLYFEDLDSYCLECFKDRVEVFNRDWIYIGGNMVLLKDILLYRSFDNKTDDDESDYESSELKEFLKEQLEEWERMERMKKKQ